MSHVLDSTKVMGQVLARSKFMGQVLARTKVMGHIIVRTKIMGDILRSVWRIWGKAFEDMLIWEIRGRSRGYLL